MHEAERHRGRGPRKRLIVCFDGTWNTPDRGAAPTNVVKIMRAIKQRDGDGVPQIAFYDAGVGTGGLLDKLVGGAFGEGLEENVKDGYRFLANNYEVGDEIYVFGFSRGAYTARSLGGFIDAIGLLRDVHMERLPEAWTLYRLPYEERRSFRGGEPLRELQALCYGQPDHEVRVRVLGVWDTVGALGIPSETLQLLRRKDRREKQFHDVRLGSYIDVALHAVAIDEKRGPFYPTLWQLDAGEAARRVNQRVEQVWFAGVHSNVGGSYADSGLSDVALDWMIRRVGALSDLEFDTDYRESEIHPEPMGVLYESRTGMYAFSRLLPCLRLIGGAEVRTGLLRKALFWLKHRELVPAPGKEFPGEMVHRSALDRLGKRAKFQKGKRADPVEMEYAPRTLSAALGRLSVVGHDGEVVEGGRAVPGAV